MLSVGFIFAALVLLSGAAKAANDAAYPWVPPDGITRTPIPRPSTPITVTVPQTYTVFLPLVMRNYAEIITPNIPFAYGWNVHQHNNYHNAGQTSFNWIKFTDPPSASSICGSNALPYNVLLRLNYAQGDTDLLYGRDRTYEWARDLKNLSLTNDLCVKAFEIGNEPNLISMYKGPVDPVDFADKLCAEYDVIKAVDSRYLVVSGGLAPTGHISDTTLVMDEEDFLRAMLNRIRDTHNGNAGACFDALGYHNYGFRTSYSTPVTDTVACPDGMCFRGAERIWEILSGEYGVQKKIWMTEMGWMRDFYTGGCDGASWAGTFAGFQNTNAEQSAQLVGAFQYARDHWPWSGGLFVFNLDFNQRPGVDQCADEQGWFAVAGYPAKTALENMTKTP